MLQELSLQNFKAIAPHADISLAELTILCGSNSSGKSSLIQAILMLSQAFSSRYDFDTMVLNGHLVRLGAFKDIFNHGSSGKEITISFKMKPRLQQTHVSPPTLIEYSCTFGAAVSASPDDEYHPHILKSSLRLHYEKDGEERVETLATSRARFPTPGESVARFKVDEITSPEVDALAKEYPDLKIIACESTSFIPTTLIGSYNRSKKAAAQTIGMMAGKAPSRATSRDVEAGLPIPRAFFSKLRECIALQRAEVEQSLQNAEELRSLIGDVGPEVAARIWAQVLEINLPVSESSIPAAFINAKMTPVKDWLGFLGAAEESHRKAIVTIIDKYRGDLIGAWDSSAPKDLEEGRFTFRSLNFVSQFLTQYFAKSVKYLGPLRNEPKAVYASEGHSDPRNVGLKGEYTAAVLHMNRERWIRYPSPVVDDQGVLDVVSKYSRLDLACKEWLSYLGVIVDYDTNDKGKLGYEISVKVESGDKWQDLTHVGVGVSQVLPIVLMALLSEPGELLIFEQPELHLHPKVQSRLCDFFCALASAGRQSIIETHSEYFINRLRLRIVQESPPHLAGRSSVFFITKQQGTSRFDRVDINEFGAILKWPEEFFDQTDQEVERILIEAAKKRRRIKEKANARYAPFL